MESQNFAIANSEAATKLLGSYFQSPETPVMEGIIHLHDDIFFFMIIIFVFVSWMLATSLIEHYSKKSLDYWDRMVIFGNVKYYTHYVLLETFWTFCPGIILILIAIPSFALIYSLEAPELSVVTVKCVARQWFWVYN